MTDQEILERAIQKAIAGGWEDGKAILKLGAVRAPQAFIFNHDFAKALWGDMHPMNDHIPNWQLAWQYHLMQMVIAEDPIQYLGKNI
jgi:hypothetical protein